MATPPGAPEDAFKTDYVIEGVKLGFPFVRTSVEKCMNMQLDPSDVLIVGFPKSGQSLQANVQ